MRLGDSLPSKVSGRCLANQLVRSGTSVAANYRAACRARSKAEFLSKLQIVIEEADETAFWLELVIESGSLPQSQVEPLRQEADEITAIMVASRKTASK
jgi:four helix bundle protein